METVQMHQSPDCYKCKHRDKVVYSAHSMCRAVGAVVVGGEHGIKNGWFNYPRDFDPVWLRACSRYEEKS